MKLLMRSLLFVPGIRPTMMEKARGLPADVIVLDLEDSVPPAEKEMARALVREAIPSLIHPGRQLYIRINSLASGLARDDLRAVVMAGLDGITIPKVGSPQEVVQVGEWLAELEEERGLGRGSIALIPWVESAAGLLQCREIAAASPRNVAVAFGVEDYSADMGLPRTKEGWEVFFARSYVAICARAAEVLALDAPYPDFRDAEGLMAEARLDRSLGYAGKFCIHPSQLEPVNQLFRPSPEEIEQARRIVAAFEEGLKQGYAAVQVEGRMIDTPIARRAQKLLELAEAIARKES